MATILQNAQKISAAIDDAYAALADRLADIPAEKTATNLSAAVESITMTTDELLEINKPARDFVFKGDVVPETEFAPGDLTAFIYPNRYTDAGAGSLFYKRGHIKTVKFNPDCDVQKAGCYQMFKDQTSLTDVKSLPAGNLSAGAFSNMFNGCTNLTSVADLSARSANVGTFNAMLSGCTSLRTPPALPKPFAIPQRVFRSMFAGCTSLTSAPELPTATPSYDAYHDMFNGCTSLSTPPAVPTRLSPDSSNASTACYQSMFFGCTALTSIPDMTAMYVGANQQAMDRMFQGCTSLSGEVTIGFTSDNTEVPMYLMRSMFTGCDNLTKIVLDFSSLAAVIPLKSTNAVQVVGTATATDPRVEIRVPAALEESWKAASNWATFAERIVGV